jgi:hypothetical protein
MKAEEPMAMCAHSYVYQFTTPMREDMTVSDYWVCLHCGTEFVPKVALKAHRREALADQAETLRRYEAAEAALRVSLKQINANCCVKCNVAIKAGKEALTALEDSDSKDRKE